MPQSPDKIACPWCGKPGVDPAKSCPSCHRSPDHHPSRKPPDDVAGGGAIDFELGSIPPPSGLATGSLAPSAGDLDDELDTGSAGGGLELVTDVSDREAAPDEGASIDLSQGGDLPDLSLGLDAFDDDSDDDEVGALEVELATGSPAEAPDSARPESARANPAVASAPAAAREAPPSSQPAPQSATAALPLDAPPATDPLEVQALANFGPAPQNILAVVPYAWRVLRRRPELRRLYGSRQVAHEQLDFECGTRYSQILSELQGKYPDDDALQRLAASLQQVAAVVQERAVQLQHAQQQTASTVTQLDQQLGELEQNRVELERERKLAQITLEDCTQQCDRARAQVKRADIELRALHEVAREAAGKGAKYAPPEHARKIATAEEERTALAGTLTQRQRALDQAKNALRVHVTALRELDRRLSGTQGQRKNAMRQGTKQESLHAEGVKLAETQRLQQCEHAIAQLMAERHPGLDAALRKEIHDLTARVRVSLADVETHRQAIDAFDRSAVRNGVIVVSVGALLLLIVLVMMVRIGGT